MTWKNSYKFAENGFQYPLPSFKSNDRCFIRKNLKCGKIFGASRSCFIACPNLDDIEPILEIISLKLANVGIEAIIAVKERAYGQDIFCTKICGKIIESKFCLVILDDLVVNGSNLPNPNVYYEYGLMTSLEKHIIPLQKDDLKLAFNIQSYDTIKYTTKNISTEIDRAIKDAIKFTESSDRVDKKYFLQERTILRNFELAGLVLKDEKWFLYNAINDTDFEGFGQSNFGFYILLGKVDEIKDVQIYLEDLSVILYRIDKIHQDLKYQFKKLEPEPLHRGYYPFYAKEITEQASSVTSMYSASVEGKLDQNVREKKEEIINKLDLISMPIYIGFIINSDIPEKDKSAFIDKAKEIIMPYRNKFKLVQDKNGEIEFGSLRINLYTHYL